MAEPLARFEGPSTVPHSNRQTQRQTTTENLPKPQSKKGKPTTTSAQPHAPTHGRALDPEVPGANRGREVKDKQKQEYTCPHCGGLVVSNVRTGQIDHWTVCGHRFCVRDGTLQEKKTHEYTCPHCGGLVASNVTTGQIDHRTVCGNRFCVRDGTIQEKQKHEYTCPHCGGLVASNVTTGQSDHRTVCGNRFASGMEQSKKSKRMSTHARIAGAWSQATSRRDKLITGQCAVTGFASGMEPSKKRKSVSTHARIVVAWSQALSRRDKLITGQCAVTGFTSPLER